MKKDGHLAAGRSSRISIDDKYLKGHGEQAALGARR